MTPGLVRLFLASHRDCGRVGLITVLVPRSPFPRLMEAGDLVSVAGNGWVGQLDLSWLIERHLNRRRPDGLRRMSEKRKEKCQLSGGNGY